MRDQLVADLTALGLDPQVESYTGVETRGHSIAAAKVSDIMARLPGSQNSRAVILTAHYDSVERAPGAGDDGGGVVTILETLRALKAGSPLKNDVIVLLTDGEEEGLLGAHAAVAHDSWLRNAGILFNFEGRGDRGVSSLFETSNDNRRLIEEFAKAVPYPEGSSLTYSIYKKMPNDTDFTAFRRVGVAGLNFAWAGGLEAYHSGLDTSANLDERSLAQDGSYALTLTRHFGNLDLNRIALHDSKGHDEVFFNWFDSYFVHYPASWMLPLWIVGSIALFGLLVVVVRRRALPLSMSIRKLALGLSGSVAILAATFLVTVGVFWCIDRIFSTPFLVGDVPSNELLVVALVLFGTAMTVAVFLWFRKRTGTLSLSAGGLLLFWVATLAMILLLPSGSYIVFWPMIFATLAFSLVTAGWRRAAWISTLSIVLLFAPLFFSMFVLLSLNVVYAGICGLLLGLCWALLAPTLDLLVPPCKGERMVYSLLGLAMLFTAVGIFLSKPSAAHPMPDTLSYAIDHDASKAVWFSYGRVPDAWTVNYLSRTPKKSSLPDYLGGAENSVLWNYAPLLPQKAPSAEIVGNEVNDGVRVLHLRVSSPRSAPAIQIVLDKGAEIIAAKIEGESVPLVSVKKLHDSSVWKVGLYGYGNAPVDVLLQIKGGQGCRYWLSDRSYSLPNLPGDNQPRPDYRLAWYGSNQLIVSRNLSFCG